MGVMTLPAIKPYHLITKNGKLIATGSGKALFEPEIQEIFWFETEAERDADARAMAYKTEANILTDTLQYVELPKNLQAYAAMRQDSLDWLRAVKAGTAEWDTELYPALAITVECCDMTPTEAAESIQAAVKQNVLDPERTRTVKREHLKQLTKDHLS